MPPHQDLKQLLETFGEIRNFNHPDGKKFAFFSYINGDVSTTAIHGLSGECSHFLLLFCSLLSCSHPSFSVSSPLPPPAQAFICKL